MGVSGGRVLIVTPRWVRDGGVATHAMASAAALAARGVEVHVACARHEDDAPAEGVTVHLEPQLLDARAPAQARLGAGLAAGPAVVHMHQLDDPALVAGVRPFAPVAISVHGYSACASGLHYFQPGHECTRPHGAGCVPNLLVRGCAHTRDPRPLPAAYRAAAGAARALRAADLVISYSSAVDRHLRENGVTRRRMVPLFGTVTPQPRDGRRERRRVVFAGRVVAPKGVGVLIRAARDVQAEFLVCGDGWQLEAMRRLARRLDVLERVRFTGWLAPAALARELAEASVVAMPSLWPEPFGLVGIEALAAGRPVVASATGGVTDWLEDGVCGMLVPPGDARALARALEELLGDPVRQEAMGAAGREMVSTRYTPARHVDALLDAYRAARAQWESAPGPSVRASAPALPSGAGAG